MAMGRQATNILGSLGVAVILAGAYFGVAAPILNSTRSNTEELQTARTVGNSYVQQLNQFKNNAQSPELQQATQSLEEFKQLVPGSIDIESASRAIAGSLPSGVKLGAFNFGAAEQVSSLKLTSPSLSGFTAPQGFGGGDSSSSSSSTSSSSSSSSTSSTEAPASGTATNGFTRIPFTITVTAGSLSELSEYLNQLSDQPRLISVVSVDSTNGESVSATIYAYAFTNS